MHFLLVIFKQFNNYGNIAKNMIKFIRNYISILICASMRLETRVNCTTLKKYFNMALLVCISVRKFHLQQIINKIGF